MRLWLALFLVPLVATAGDYKIGIGDRLTITVYDEPDLSADVVVSETCSVSLAHVGAVDVCGKTTFEIERRVTRAYDGDYLVNPTVAVKVSEYHSQRVDVLGAAVKIGPLYLEGPTSLLEVISLAGGPTAENVVRVDLVSSDGSMRTFDMNALTAVGEPVAVQPGDKVVLKPGEVVYVEGSIRSAGAVTLSEGLTVTQALAMAGGPDEYASLRRVMLRRADGSQERVNVTRIHKGLEEDRVLKPDDYLIVPRGAF